MALVEKNKINFDRAVIAWFYGLITDLQEGKRFKYLEIKFLNYMFLNVISYMEFIFRIWKKIDSYALCS